MKKRVERFTLTEGETTLVVERVRDTHNEWRVGLAPFDGVGLWAPLAAKVRGKRRATAVAVEYARRLEAVAELDMRLSEQQVAFQRWVEEQS